MIAGSYRVFESVNGAIGASTTARWYVNSGDLTKNTLADRSFINQLNYAWSDNTRAIVGTNDGNVQMGFDLGQGAACLPPGVPGATLMPFPLQIVHKPDMLVIVYEAYGLVRIIRIDAEHPGEEVVDHHRRHDQ